VNMSWASQENEMIGSKRLDESELKSLVDHASHYFLDMLHPLQQRMDDQDWFPSDQFRALGEMGFFGITVPEE
jgi:isovaleryl-CoA dehydrogenase